MENKFNSPEFILIQYKKTDSGKFEKIPELVPFTRMPEILKVEQTQDERIRNNGAEQIISGPIKGGKRQFFTGLIPVPDSNYCYWGNDYTPQPGNKKNSLVIFRFSPDYKTLSVYYFGGFYKDSRLERVRFVSNFIQSI